MKNNNKELKNLFSSLVSFDERREWRPIEEFVGTQGYYVSNLGEVVSTKRSTPRLLAQYPHSKDEYMMVCLSLGEKGKKKSYRVHRLVALAFVENPHPEEYKDVQHLDENKFNNVWTNLSWATPLINNGHKSADRRVCGPERKVECIETGQVFRNLRAAGDKVGRSKGTIRYAIDNGSCCGGYHFKFWEDPNIIIKKVENHKPE